MDFPQKCNWFYCKDKKQTDSITASYKNDQAD